MNRPVPVPTAEALAAAVELSAPARALLRDGLKADEFLALLERERLFRDAVQVVAHWLPPRSAVWWACQCVWSLYRPVPPGQVEEAALKAALRWVVDPSEAHRRAAEAAGQAAGLNRPAGGVALAAAWSGGSLAPPGLPVVAPPPHLTALTVGKALLLTAALAPPEQTEGHLHSFLNLGRELALNQAPWERRAAALKGLA